MHVYVEVSSTVSIGASSHAGVHRIATFVYQNIKVIHFDSVDPHFKSFCLHSRPAASEQEITASLSLLGPEVGGTVKGGTSEIKCLVLLSVAFTILAL